MNLTLTFTIPIAPRGKARARATTFGGKARMFQPKQDRDHATTFAALASQHAPEGKIEGPVKVTIEARMERTKAVAATVKRTGEPKFPGRPPHTVKPDADNIGKMVLDAMKSWWRDDAQVCDLHIIKAYAAPQELPCYVVTVAWHEKVFDTQ